MPRRRITRTRALTAAATAATTGILALSGCAAGTSAAAPGDTTPGRSATGPGGARSLIVEPEAGFSPVYRLINGARRSIDVTMYELADTTAEHDLAAAAGRGVTVRIILDRREKRRNAGAYSYFRGHGIEAVWSSAGYYYTHQKTVIADGSEAVIMTANLTSRYYATSRDFLVLDTARADISAIEAVFDADYAHQPIRPGDASGLVWSPGNSEQALLALIKGASSRLRIYSEEMSDLTIEDALIAASHRGIDVQICGENHGGEYDSAYARLAAAGIHISYYSSPRGFYIHAKVIEADYGTPYARAFIGSENFSRTSLRGNRELGLIISGQAALTAISGTFAGDFRAGEAWT